MGERRLDLLLAAASAGTFAIGGVLAPVAPGPEGDALPTICPFRSATGVPCPFCGMTRSFTSLLHGRTADAFAHHPVGPLLAAGMAVVLVLVVWRAMRRRSPLSAGPRFASAALVAGAACVVVGTLRTVLGRA